MKEQEFIGSGKSILRKYPDREKEAEKRKARKILAGLLVLSVVLVIVPIGFRVIPEFFGELVEPVTITSENLSSPTRPLATPTPALTMEKTVVEKVTASLQGDYGVYYEDLQSGRSFNIKGEAKFTAASLMKLPVMAALYKEAEAGRVDLDTVYKLKNADKRGGAGAIQYQPAGTAYTYRKLAEYMGQQSDNTAYNVIANVILGGSKVQAEIDRLGMKNTSFEDGETTPNDIGLFFRELYGGKVVSESGKEEILKFLTKTIWEDRIPAGLPSDVVVAHKIGTEIHVFSDAGIVYAKKPFVLAIISENVKDAEAIKALPDITRTVYSLTNGS